MKRLRRALAALASALLLSAPLAAQGEDARVLPRGVVGVRVAGEFAHYDSRLGGERGGPLGSPFTVALPASLFPPLDTVRARLAGVFAATGGNGEEFPLTAEDLVPGTLDVGVAANERSVPISLEVGVARRLTLWTTVPVERRGADVAGVRLLDGAVGRNLRADSLARLFRDAGPAFQALAGLRYLPLAGSRAGQELQRRFTRATGDTTRLPLPQAPLAAAQIDTLLASGGFDALPFRDVEGRYYLGDVEVGAKLQLVNSVEDTLGGTGVRLAVAGALRLPTGQGAGLDSLAAPVSGWGHAGGSGSVFLDLVGRRLAVSAAASYAVLTASDVLRYGVVVDSGGVVPRLGAARTVRRDPGDALLLAVTPRYRLTEEISLAGRYAFARFGETVFPGEELVDPVPGFRGFSGLESTAARSGQRIGVGAGYSTLGAFLAGRTPLPLEVSLLWETTVAGSGGIEDASVVRMEGRVMYPFWGRGR